MSGIRKLKGKGGNDNNDDGECVIREGNVGDDDDNNSKCGIISA
jgi:hypothetical protein